MLRAKAEREDYEERIVNFAAGNDGRITVANAVKLGIPMEKAREMLDRMLIRESAPHIRLNYAF